METVFYYESGVKLTSWQEVGGYWYYLGVDAAMQTGWKEIDGIWYYMHSDGRMASSEWMSYSGCKSLLFFQWHQRTKYVDCIILTTSYPVNFILIL